MNKIFINKYLFIIFLIIILCLPVLLPLFHQGIFKSDDANWIIIRLSDFHAGLRDGQFPVRWAGRLNHGYGYPVFNFLYPGVYYLGEIFHLLKFNTVDSIKILFGLSILCSALFSYLWLRLRFTRISALSGSLIYVFFPYHLFDIYTRGSVGEALALGFIPLILYAINRKRIILGSIGYALLIITHNTLSLLFTPLLLSYVILFFRKNFSLYLIFILGWGISAFFWFPAIFDRRFTVFDSLKISDWQQYFLSAKNIFILGWVSLSISIFSTVIIIIKRNKQDIFFLVTFLISIFFSSAGSMIIWSHSPLPKLVQFPWRFLSLTTISSSFLLALIIDAVPGKLRLLFTAGMVIIIGLSSYPLLRDIQYENHEIGYYDTNEDTTTVKNEYMPIWAAAPLTNHPDNRAEIIKGEGRVEVISKNSNKIALMTAMRTEGKLKINDLYFPGWYAKIDNKSQNIIQEDKTGLITMAVPEGSHRVILEWKETPLRLFADIVSLVSLFTLLGLVIRGLTSTKQ